MCKESTFLTNTLSTSRIHLPDKHSLASRIHLPEKHSLNITSPPSRQHHESTFLTNTLSTSRIHLPDNITNPPSGQTLFQRKASTLFHLSYSHLLRTSLWRHSFRCRL